MDAPVIQTVKKKSKGHRCYFCGVKFMDIKILKRHITTHRDRPHTCEFCEKAFTDKSTLRKHRFTHTGQRPFQCEFCGKTFTLNWSLTKHIEYTHDSKTCLTCGKTMTKSEKYNQSDLHCFKCKCKGKKVAKDGHFSCLICNSDFENVESLDEHMVTHQVSRGLTNKVISEKSTLDENELSHCVKKIYQCEFCGKIYSFQWELMKHKESAHSINGQTCIPVRMEYDGTLSCSICSSQFENADSLDNHMTTHQNNNKPVDTETSCSQLLKKFNCSMCGKKFRTPTGLSAHWLSHSEERPYHCQQCNRQYKDWTGLRKHMVTHNEETPYQCTTCKMSFKAPHTLRHHFKTHTEVRPFVCSDCGSSFKSSCILKKHMLTHQIERPFECNECGGSFKSVASLKQHQQIHIDNKPYSCSICNKSFKFRVSCHRHMRIHTGELPYPCPYCAKKFSRAHSLKVHLTIHMHECNLSEHTCQICGRLFKSMARLHKHMLNH